MLYEVITPQTLPFQPSALNHMVIYELHVGTFGEGDGNPPFNFEAVIAKLPYLRVLGVNAIELMPVKAFPGELSWGYNPAHPFAISQVYGGPDRITSYNVCYTKLLRPRLTNSCSLNPR